MRRDLKRKFIFMARKKGVCCKIDFYYDKKIRAWLVRLNNGAPQIIGDNYLDVAFNIGNGFLKYGAS